MTLPKSGGGGRESIKNDDIHRYHESRITRLEVTNENINSTLLDFKSEFRDIKDTLKDIRSELKDIRKEARQNFMWLLSIILAGYSSLFALIAHVAKWF